MVDINKLMREIPSVNYLLEDEEIKTNIKEYGNQVILEAIRCILQDYKEELLNHYDPNNIVSTKGHLRVIKKRLNKELMHKSYSRLRKVINGTGLILHTNLGRAPLPKSVLEHVMDISQGYSNLEYELINGKRGSRHKNIEELLVTLTGAEAALVLNNNAAALLTTLNTFAEGKEIIVSRGELIEIGGSFRVPEIIQKSGCKMREIGTTNKTHLHDYEKAIHINTGAVLKVHKSNFRVEGFAAEVKIDKLVSLCKDKHVITIEDLGSGNFVDLRAFGLDDEPKIQDSIKAGADLVTFSGDKLLGGPQAGIIVGKKSLIEAIKKNPLARAMRMDKMSLAALEGILLLYLDKDNIINTIPLYQMLSKNMIQLENEARVLIEIILNYACDLKIRMIKTEDEVGGGSLPLVKYEGRGIGIKSDKIKAHILQEALRIAPIPIICMVSEDELIINLRTIFEEDYEIIGKQISEIVKKR